VSRTTLSLAVADENLAGLGVVPGDRAGRG
jgi:hypothetical protein